MKKEKQYYKIVDIVLNAKSVKEAKRKVAEFFTEEKKKWVEEIENMELVEYQGNKISAYLKRKLKSRLK